MGRQEASPRQKGLESKPKDRVSIRGPGPTQIGRESQKKAAIRDQGETTDKWIIDKKKFMHHRRDKQRAYHIKGDGILLD